MASKIYSVTGLNQEIKSLLEIHPPFRNVFVQGEISNYKAHPSGHHYLTLKDEDAAINAVMFRTDAARLRFRLQNGMKVIAHGRVSSFPKSGQVQLYLSDLMPDGEGALHTAFEQIKAQLAAEGFFAEAHKRPIPRMPMTIGLITAPTGAAVHDMLRILQRRWPLAKVQVYPALVQGAGAPDDLCRALRDANRQQEADVLIIGRGGGSLEELWAFNTEAVARAIYASNIPVISAVGHEPDVTIADYVADLRAPTPSAAAELVSPDITALYLLLQQKKNALKSGLLARVRTDKHRLALLAQRLSRHTPAQTIADRRLLLEHFTQRLAARSPRYLVQNRRLSLHFLQSRLQALVGERLSQEKQRVAQLAAALDALSPLKVLARGYTVVYDENRLPVTGCAQLSRGQNVQVRFADGTADCTVTEIRKARGS